MSIYLESLCWMEFFPKYNSREGWNKNVLAGKNFKKSLARGTSIRHQRVPVIYFPFPFPLTATDPAPKNSSVVLPTVI